MPYSRNVTRISDKELSAIDLTRYHIIGAIARDQDPQASADDPRSGSYVEVKPDRRLPPLVSQQHPAPDMTPSILLIEVDDPSDPGALQKLKERVA